MKLSSFPFESSITHNNTNKFIHNNGTVSKTEKSGLLHNFKPTQVYKI